MFTEHMRKVIAEQQLGFFATVRPDGTPSVSPKGTIRVWDDDHLAFADIASPGTVANLRANPAVEVNVVDPFSRRGYRFRGRGRVVDAGEEFDRALEVFAGSVARPRERIRAVVLVHVESASAIVSPAYAIGATEEKLKAAWRRYYDDLLAGRPARLDPED